MPKYTPNLNIQLADPATDGNQTFNIDTMINNPVEKVDEALGLVPVSGDVRVATTGNIVLSGAQTIDGIALAAGNRVLVKNQTAGKENGIYTVATGAWTRAVDANSTAKLAAGISVYVEEGAANGKSRWQMTNTGTVTLDTTAITFEKTGGAASATDTVIGSRTISDTTAPTGDSGTVTTLFGWLASMIKAITGGATWRTLPGMSIAAIKTVLDAATNAATASTLMKRDSSGRAQVAAPSAAADVATKSYVDTTVTGVAVPDASLTAKGKVQLSSAINSTSEVMAATSKAVKEAYDQGSAGVAAAAAAQASANISVSKENGYWPGNDANTCTIAGTYYFTNDSLNTPTGDWCTILVVSGWLASDRLLQIANVWNLSDDIYCRRLNGSRWSPWAKLWTSYNVGEGSGLISDSSFKIVIPDKRSINAGPNGYGGQNVYHEFKSGNVIGLPEENFCMLVTYRPWVDNSGGSDIQKAFGVTTGNEYIRSGSGSSWGAWRRSWDTSTLRDNNGTLEFFTGGVWKPVGAIGQSKTGNGSVAYSYVGNLVTLTGPGMLKELYLNSSSSSGSGSATFEIVADNNVIDTGTYPTTINLQSFGPGGYRYSTGGSSAVPTIDVAYKNSLIIRIVSTTLNSSSGNTNFKYHYIAY